jgi:hypothetical protein
MACFLLSEYSWKSVSLTIWYYISSTAPHHDTTLRIQSSGSRLAPLTRFFPFVMILLEVSHGNENQVVGKL